MWSLPPSGVLKWTADGSVTAISHLPQSECTLLTEELVDCFQRWRVWVLNKWAHILSHFVTLTLTGLSVARHTARTWITEMNKSEIRWMIKQLSFSLSLADHNGLAWVCARLGTERAASESDSWIDCPHCAATEMSSLAHYLQPAAPRSVQPQADNRLID